MSRSLRTFSILARPCIHARPFVRCRHSILEKYGEVRIQPVRFRKDNRNRLLKIAIEFAIVCALVEAAWRYLDLNAEEEEGADKTTALTKTQSEDEEHAEEGEDEVDIPETMPEDAIFIPLGLTRQRPETFYKGTDPEWQSFIEYRKDREREPAVKRELASLVGGYFANLKPMQTHMGMPMKVQNYWFDVLIPSGPPPEYERSGLEITDEYVAWTTRPVSALQLARLQSALFPLPMAKSFWASYSTYWSLQVARIKQLLNVDPSSENSKPGLPPGMMNLDQIQESGANKASQSNAKLDKMADPKSSDVSSAKGSSRPSLSDTSKILSSLPSIPQVGGDLGSAVMEFKRTLAKTWRPPHAFGERGTFVVTGLVRLEGPKAFCVVDIKAAYHPRERRYTQIAGGVKYFIPKKQGPVRLKNQGSKGTP